MQQKYEMLHIFLLFTKFQSLREYEEWTDIIEAFLMSFLFYGSVGVSDISFQVEIIDVVSPLKSVIASKRSFAKIMPII